MRIRVVLSKPDPEYDIGRNNPKTGTEYECEGTVDRIDGTSPVYYDGDDGVVFSKAVDVVEGNLRGHNPYGVAIQVNWDNGTSNTYKPGEMSVINSKAPRCASIW